MRLWFVAFLVGLFLICPAQARQAVMMSVPHVAHVADLPDNAGFQGYSMDRGQVSLDLGWSYREISAFWMPFWAKSEAGLVLYSKNPDGSYMLAPVTSEELTRIKELTGKDFTSEYRFPIWNHIWGWVPVLLILGFVLWLRRRESRAREVQGLM